MSLISGTTEQWESSALDRDSTCTCTGDPGNLLTEVTDDDQHAGTTPLHAACRRPNAAVIQYLLENGAAVNAVTAIESKTPLQVLMSFPVLDAIPDICALLVSYGASIHTPDSTQLAPLHHAVSSNHMPCIAALLSAQDKYPDVVSSALITYNGLGKLPLHTAVYRGHVDCCKALIGAGADVNSGCLHKSMAGSTPLCMAVMTGNLEVIQLLLQSAECQVEKVGTRKRTPMLKAAYQGNADVVQLLLLSGAKTEVYDDEQMTPLLVGIFTGQNDVVRLLIDGGADINFPGASEYTALHHAAWRGMLDAVAMLLDSGADDDGPTNDGNTPLALAAHGECLDVLRLLIDRGCHVNVSDKDKDSPLLYTVHNGDIEGSKLLMDHVADCHVRNRADQTTTWSAAHCGHTDLLKYLIVHGNPPLSVPSRGLVYDHDGYCAPYIYNEPLTPLYVAIVEGHNRVAETLLDAGVLVWDEPWCWSASWMEDMDVDFSECPSLLSRLNDFKSAAPSLLEISRQCLRSYIGQQILAVVPQLQVPSTLKEYLTLQSLDHH